jgi:hypothetical protein
MPNRFFITRHLWRYRVTGNEDLSYTLGVCLQVLIYQALVIANQDDRYRTVATGGGLLV